MSIFHDAVLLAILLPFARSWEVEACGILRGWYIIQLQQVQLKWLIYKLIRVQAQFRFSKPETWHTDAIRMLS